MDLFTKKVFIGFYVAVALVMPIKSTETHNSTEIQSIYAENALKSSINDLKPKTTQDTIEAISIEQGLTASEIQLLLKIAQCESGLRQFDEKGEVLRGKVNPSDIGVFQINEKYWLEQSQKLNFDIYSEEGNVKMAVWIFKKYGESPWLWSFQCWSDVNISP